jgi:rhamnogalacturonan endolyase
MSTPAVARLILTNVDTVPIAINEVRMNTRWDRAIFDHAYNWERGGGQQPTYAYLATQQQVQDETWRVDGVNNPNLPSPTSNSGNLPPGTVYTKYNWSLYHHENPMFGHYGNGFGVWFTALGGVTDRTLGAFYGVGPNHQDLAVHQDALILNYFGANLGIWAACVRNRQVGQPGSVQPFVTGLQGIAR